MTRPGALRRNGRDALVDRLAGAASAFDVFDAVAPRLRRLVPFDAAAWIGTDPGTGLPTSPVRIDDLPGVSRAMCSEHWEHELLGDDVNQFRHLARADVPAAALRSTVEDPADSRRHRTFLEPLGLDDELRAVLRVGDTTWGTVTLWRRAGRTPFTAGETALLASIAGPMGAALRRHVRPCPELGEPIPTDGPGLLVFDDGGELVSVNEDARVWLAELPAGPTAVSAHGVEVPVWMMIAVFRAGAVRRGWGDGIARTRVQTRAGRWLVCHASCLRASDGSFGTTAVVVEPAPPAMVARVVVEAYDLSPREQEVVARIARGARTAEIADALHVSPHTVRDHVKAIFAKVRVSSRGELVAKLFADFYEPVHTTEASPGGGA